MIGIVDNHMHCIPGVDDGSRDMEMSLEMLRTSYKQGVRTVMCTSHSFAFEDHREMVLEQYDKLKAKCHEVLPGLKLYLGCEILCYPEIINNVIEGIKLGIYPRMNDTNYVLIEFYPDEAPENICYCAKAVHESGYVPIIAHAERYMAVREDLAWVRLLKELGALIQINAYSLVQEKNSDTKNAANAYVKNRFVDLLGTDAHRIGHRPPEMEIGSEYLYKITDKAYADAICFENAKRLFEI